MFFFLLLLLVLMISKAELAPANGFQRDYISRDHANTIKGIFIILVFLSHGKGYVQLSGQYDELYLAVQNHLGQMIVSMFLFYSGFGMMEQLRIKGRTYLQSIPRKRFPQLLLNFNLAVLLYLILALVLRDQVSIQKVLLSLIGLESIGNSNWYIFVILGLYICMFLSFLFLKTNSLKEQCIGAVVFTILSVGFVVLLAKAGKQSYWYNTIILFSAGLWFSLLRPALEKLVMKNDLTYWVALAAVIAAYMAFYSLKKYHFVFYELWACCFVATTLLLTMKIAINSKFLNFLGTHLFGIYMLQRIPFRLLSSLELFQRHRYEFMILSFAITIVIALLFELLTQQLSKRLWKQSAGRTV